MNDYNTWVVNIDRRGRPSRVAHLGRRSDGDAYRCSPWYWHTLCGIGAWAGERGSADVPEDRRACTLCLRMLDRNKGHAS